MTSEDTELIPDAAVEAYERAYDAEVARLASHDTAHRAGLSAVISAELLTLADGIERDGGTVMTAEWAAHMLRQHAADVRWASANAMRTSPGQGVDMNYLNPHTHNLDGDGSLKADRPRIVCLCGSTRFGEAFREANLRETLAGRIVLSVGCDTKSDSELWSDPAEAARVKAELDELHKRKIDLADEVMVLNVKDVDGVPYIGESTRSEIEYAEAHGKPVRYLNTEVPSGG